MKKPYDIKRFNNYKLNNSIEVLNNTEKYFNSLLYKKYLTESNEYGEKVPIINEDGEEAYRLEYAKPPTIVGYANALGVAKTTIEKYRDMAEEKKIPEYDILVAQIEEVQLARAEQVKTGGKRVGLSFTEKTATKDYEMELREALEIRKVINIINYGYSVIEEYNNERLYDSGGIRGATFSLKSLFGYSEKQEVDLNVGIKLEDFLKDY